MLPLAGYAEKLSVRPGETIRFHVSNSKDAAIEASLVRVVCADPNPAGPGIITHPVSAAGLRDIAKPETQFAMRGSKARIATADRCRDLDSLTFIATIRQTRRCNATRDEDVAGGIACLYSRWKDGECAPQPGAGFFIAIDHSGHLLARFGDLEHTAAIVPLHEWLTVALMIDGTKGTGALAWRRQDKLVSTAPWIAATFELDRTTIPGADTLVLGDGFDGRMERPMVFDRALTTDEIDRALRGEAVDGLLAAWDFSREMGSSRILDTGPHGLHGALINTPTRAVRGSNWTGREQCFRHAPEQYGAIHFHTDDIDDCRWPATHEYHVPTDLRSGVYALMLKAGNETENIPFFVVPPKGKTTAKLAVLVSTFTYTVYGNHARPEWMRDPVWREAWKKQSKDWPGAYPHNPGDHADYGLSTYNYHTDGSGIAMASWRRPMLNLRVGYITYPYPDIRGSGLRHFPADSHITAWLEATGQDYDIITDQELHDEGLDLLRPYTAVMTGTHPEYHTTEMLDALEAYRDQGGRLMYLGGNGFYWKIALSPEQPGLIEIRRAEGGIRAWAAEPGEYYNQFDAEYGGLWRRNGRPPQCLVGVGFTAQGNFVGSHYRIDPAARAAPETAWMFDGVKTETIGGYGLSGHGAAGFELDRADTRLGTPAHARVVARSENHPPDAPWVLVPEEQLTHITTITGATHAQLIRADMTLFGTAGGCGAVFSVGSITYCGSLPHNGFDNDIARLTGNVLARFLDPAARFPMA